MITLSQEESESMLTMFLIGIMDYLFILFIDNIINIMREGYDLNK